MLLPLVGGFNDGKYIEPKGRDEIKMARPSDFNGSISHYENSIGFEYEMYKIEYIDIGGKILNFYMIEGMSLSDALERIIFGYKKFNKTKSIDIVKNI